MFHVLPAQVFNITTTGKLTRINYDYYTQNDKELDMKERDSVLPVAKYEMMSVHDSL